MEAVLEQLVAQGDQPVGGQEGQEDPGQDGDDVHGQRLQVARGDVSGVAGFAQEIGRGLGHEGHGGGAHGGEHEQVAPEQDGGVQVGHLQDGALGPGLLPSFGCRFLGF